MAASSKDQPNKASGAASTMPRLRSYTERLHTRVLVLEEHITRVAHVSYKLDGSGGDIDRGAKADTPVDDNVLASLEADLTHLAEISDALETIILQLEEAIG